MKNNKPDDTAKEKIIELPEVKDIPGQEHVKPPHMGEMIDTTASSADEEGKGLLDELNKEKDQNSEEDIDPDVDVTQEEIKLLDQSDRLVTDEAKDLQKMALDTIDETDDLPNEGGDPLDMGKDLDVPGSELDDDNEELGEEDEENNSYSRRD